MYTHPAAFSLGHSIAQMKYDNVVIALSHTLYKTRHVGIQHAQCISEM